MTEREAWIAFSTFIPIGPARFSLLRTYYKSAVKAWKAPPRELLRIGMSEKLVKLFDTHRQALDLDNYLQTIGKYSIKILTLLDKTYPKNLKEIDGSPSVLYFKGNASCLNALNLIAIVGSRKMSSYGRQVTEMFATELVRSGVVIVSGLARGIDTIAHKSTIEAGGRTIAVIGSGLNKIYPPENFNLVKEIVDARGALVSEYPLDYPALPFNFASRNRIISGLSKGILVIEGGEKSGTLLTASHAADQGRTVFAIPGQISSPNSFAPHLLIKQGAKMVTSVQDIKEELV